MFESLGMAQKLAEQLLSIIESVMRERRSHYEKPDNIQKNLDPDEIHRIKHGYARENAAITGAANLIPGPWGLLAILPEIILVTTNQIKMIYDIGRSKGKEGYINSDLLLYILASAFGTGLGGLGVIQGGKILVKRSSLRLVQNVITNLAGKITQKAIKAAIGKFLPIVGAVGLSAWAYKTTCDIADIADDMFSKEIEIDSDGPKPIADNKSSSINSDETPYPSGENTDSERWRCGSKKADEELEIVHLLMNLALADGMKSKEEKSYLMSRLYKNLESGVTDRKGFEKMEFVVNSWEASKLDQKSFSILSSQKLNILGYMIDLARCDGVINQREADFIFEVSNRFDFPRHSVQALITKYQ